MHRATIQDVAQEAGVSVATVDRVLNGRQGVREVTVARVEDAIRRLDYHPDRLAARLARKQSYRFGFVLPEGKTGFLAELDKGIKTAIAQFSQDRVHIDTIRTDVFDAQTLATTLEQISDDRFGGLAVVAQDDPTVREAIDGLIDRGIDIVSLVSDAPSTRRAHFVGIDNSAAGRTAASLIGKITRVPGQTPGRVLVIAGSLTLRDHMERYYGFQQILEREYPNLEAMPVVEGRDDPANNFALVEAALRENPDICAIYSIGAGNRGISDALEQGGRADDVVFVAHDLTTHTRKGLLKGTIDAIINQNVGHEVRSAVRVLMALSDNTPILADQERIRIDIFLRDNIP